MVNYTEKWKKCKLEEYTKYYCKSKWFEDIFQARCYNKDTEDEWWVLKNERYNYNNVYHTNDIEVLAPVPSFEQWQSLNELLDSMNDTNKALAHRLNMLKELLKECKNLINECIRGDYKNELCERIDEVLK